MANEPIRSTLPQLHVMVNGVRLPDDAYTAILEGVVESSLHLPDACTLRIHDHDFKWLDSAHWKEGNSVKIEAGQGQDPLIKVFDGEVTTLEMDLAAMGSAMLTVRCMDKAHRLHRGKNRKTFQQVKDSDIVSDIATKGGLKSKIDTTGVIHDWVIQNNQTDWEFLQFLAQRNGHRVYLEDKETLCFKKIEDNPSNQLDLEWGKTLRSFRIKVNSSNQVNKVTVRSWDPKMKQVVIGQATKANGGPNIAQRTDGGRTAQQAFGQAEMVVVDRPVRTAQEAEKMAQSVCDDIGASFIEADGLCYNMPQLKPGNKVNLKNIGNRFNGSYIVTTTTHTFSAAEGFSTQFVISGKEPATLMSILGGGGGGGGSKTASKGSPNAGNIVIGIVTDNHDPDGLFRVKVKFPALAEDLQTFWIRIASPMAGRERGFMFLPEVDDEVLVAFENGDVHQGYVIGQLWNGKDTPPTPNSKMLDGGQVRHRRIKSRTGHVLDFDDRGRIVMQTKNGHRLVLNDTDSSASLKTEGGLEFRVDDQVGQVVIFTPSGETIGIDDKMRKISLQDSMGNFIELDGMAGSISVAAVTTLNVKSTGTINVSGTMVNINAGPAAASKSSFQKSTDKSKQVENN